MAEGVESLDPLAVIMVAAFSSLLSLGVGGLAIRAILNNKLITIASHNEHVRQWTDQVEGLRQRLVNQAEEHAQERVRSNEVAERRIAEAKQAADDRVEDRNRQILEMARERDRLHAAIALADESYREVTAARMTAQDSGLHAVASVLRASPLFDPSRHTEIPTVVGGDDRPDGPQPSG